MGLDSQNLDLQYEKNTKPLVAVWMVTYNHESYIAQAIESILLQKTNYDFKIYIGEDCSNDTTSKICQEYKKKQLGTKLENKTILFITHNVDNLENFDNIYKIKNKTISQIK
jgi:glycosyltransferase involved in cell wall biosynthesis